MFPCSCICLGCPKTLLLKPEAVALPAAHQQGCVAGLELDWQGERPLVPGSSSVRPQLARFQGIQLSGTWISEAGWEEARPSSGEGSRCSCPLVPGGLSPPGRAVLRAAAVTSAVRISTIHDDFRRTGRPSAEGMQSARRVWHCHSLGVFLRSATEQPPPQHPYHKAVPLKGSPGGSAVWTHGHTWCCLGGRSHELAGWQDEDDAARWLWSAAVKSGPWPAHSRSGPGGGLGSPPPVLEQVGTP